MSTFRVNRKGVEIFATAKSSCVAIVAISSQSTQMQEFDILIQKLMCDNKEKSSELQVIKAKVRELINARGNYIQINKVDAQTKVSEFIQRSELSVPEVKHMGNRTKIAESIQFNNNSPSRVKESAADVCILDCNGTIKVSWTLA